jgi:dolichol kinase
MGDGRPLAPLVARTEGPQPWRRLFHAASGVGIATGLVLLEIPWGVAVGLLALLTLLAAGIDLLRLTRPAVNVLFFRVLRPLASPREARRVASSTWYLLGILLAVAFFPRSVAVPAILVLALADPAASYLGRRWGRRRLGAGTVEGSLVFLGVALAVLVPLAGWLVGTATALVTAVVEVIPLPVDDNLLIPLLSGALLWSLLPLWG